MARLEVGRSVIERRILRNGTCHGTTRQILHCGLEWKTWFAATAKGRGGRNGFSMLLLRDGTRMG